jgi:hypothetical protein
LVVQTNLLQNIFVKNIMFRLLSFSVLGGKSDNEQATYILKTKGLKVMSSGDWKKFRM